MSRTYRYRSFFWPAVLILVGVVALLVNTGQLGVERLFLLVNLWPLILVVIGLELIVRRTVHGPSADIAAAVVIVLAIVGSAAYIAIAPGPSGNRTLDASGDVAGATEGSVEIDAGAAHITINAGTGLGTKLFQAHIEYSGSKPNVRSENGAVTISQSTNSFLNFGNPRFVLKLDLNSDLPWKLEVNTGSATNTINAQHVNVTGLTLNTGASREDITLGAPKAIVPVEINSGAVTANIHRPSGTPTSVSVSGGVVNLTADGKSSHAIGEANFETPGFSSAAAGYRVQINGGACTVRLDSTPASD